MAAVTVTVVAKKALDILLASKKGRKFLLYTVGIVLFLVLLPLIVLVGLFGFLSSGSFPLDAQQIIAGLPAEDRAMVESINTGCASIRSVFLQRGLTEGDAQKAVAIYMACLLDKQSETVAEDLADCFAGVSDTVSVYDKISEAFSVEFTPEDEKYFDQKYGVTEKETEQTTEGEKNDAQGLYFENQGHAA